MPIEKKTTNVALAQPEFGHQAWQQMFYRNMILMDLWLDQLRLGNVVLSGGNLSLVGGGVDLDATVVQFGGGTDVFSLGAQTPIVALSTGITYLVYVDNAGALQVTAINNNALWTQTLPSDIALLGIVFEIEKTTQGTEEWVISNAPIDPLKSLVGDQAGALLKFRNKGAGDLLEFLKTDTGAVVSKIDNEGVPNLGTIKEFTADKGIQADDVLLKDGAVNYGPESGAADAYVVTLAQAPSAYKEGMSVAFKATNTNTGASTINVNGLGVKTILRGDGSVLKQGDIISGHVSILRYNGTEFELVNPGTDRYTPPLHISGLVIANNVTDAAKDIDIATGEARDIADADTLELTSALTKQIDASWAVGTDAGGLDGTESVAGTPDADTWYHVWLIKRSDTGVVDVLFSESATAPTMPASYDYKRRIGAVLTDATPDIIAFAMYESLSGIRAVEWDDPPLDVSVTNLGTAAVQYVLSVPLGIQVKVAVNVFVLKTVAKPVVYIRNPAVNDEAPSLSTAPLGSISAEDNAGHAARIELMTDTSAQISARASEASVTLRVATLGWEE